jgi:hypothetical protein
MSDVPAFSIGRPSEDHLTVTPLSRPHDQCHDYWDGNWIESRVEMRVGGFSGRFDLPFEEMAGSHYAAYLLAGHAVENAAKAALVARDPTDLGSHGGHGLLGLAEVVAREPNKRAARATTRKRTPQCQRR